MIKINTEAGKVSLMLRTHRSDELFRTAPLLTSPHHYRGSVGVISADVNRSMTNRLLESYPDIRLNRFNQMPKMDLTIRIWESTGN